MLPFNQKLIICLLLRRRAFVQGVANTLTQGTKAVVDTKTKLLKGLTGADPASLQADASSNTDSVQRNERGSAGYPNSGAYVRDILRVNIISWTNSWSLFSILNHIYFSEQHTI